MDEKLKKILCRLQAQCSRREYCIRDIMAKAQKAVAEFPCPEEAVNEIMESLLADKFVDNLRYASSFAREKSSLQGWGPEKIRFMLRAKGIEPETISAALSEISPAAAEKKMKSVLEAKYRTVAEDRDAKLKLLKYGLQRGYSYDDLKNAVDEIIRRSTP